MRVSFFTIVLLLNSHVITAQNEFISPIKTVSHSVAFLSETIHDTYLFKNKVFEIWYKEKGKEKYIPKVIKKSGTSFFVTDTISSVYLVTAAHVAKELSLNSDIVFHGANDTPLVYKLKNILAYKDSLTWTYHKTADVACILVDIDTDIYRNSFIYPIPIHFIERDRIPIREREVTTIGFPFNLGYEKYFSPISKISKPSSSLIELPRFDNNIISSFYLLDDPSIKGFSGSPVFELPTNLMYNGQNLTVNTIALVGLIHGSYGDNNTFGGFTAVAPSKAIIDVIEQTKKFTGKRTSYHNNGKVWSEIVIKDGKLWEVLSNYDIKGIPKEKGSLKNGNGSLYLYNPDGNLREISHYQNGILIKNDKIIK